MSCVSLFLINCVVLSLAFVSTRLSSNSFTSQIKIPSYAFNIINNLIYLVRYDGVAYSYESDEITNISQLKATLLALVEDIEKGGLTPRLGLIFTELEIKQITFNCVGALRALCDCNDEEQLVNRILTMFVEMHRFVLIGGRDIDVVPFTKLIQTIASPAEESRPLGARSYRRYKNSVITCSKDVNYTNMMISVVFVSEVRADIPMLGGEQVLGYPTMAELVFEYN